MRRLIAFALTFFCVLGLVGCNNRTVNEPEMYNSSMQDDFSNAIPAEVNDNSKEELRDCIGDLYFIAKLYCNGDCSGCDRWLFSESI